MTKEALKLALEALEFYYDMHEEEADAKAITAIKEALANEALDRMADNARELGLDYEQPAQDQGQSCYCSECERLSKELDAIKAQQQPYGWKVYGVNSLFMGEFAESDAKAEAKRIGGTCITFPLYTSPQQQPLTDEEITTIWRKSEHMTVVEVARAIEAKLKEKNT